jgi:hypothetical protein
MSRGLQTRSSPRRFELKFDADPGAPLSDLTGAAETVGEATESQPI